MGLVAIEVADEAYTYGDQDAAEYYLEAGKAFLDIAVGLDPVTGLARDVHEFIVGHNLITGEKLSTFERAMAFVGISTLGIGSAVKNIGAKTVQARSKDLWPRKLNAQTCRVGRQLWLKGDPIRHERRNNRPPLSPGFCREHGPLFRPSTKFIR